MCGIAGYIKEKPEKEILKKMTDRIAHRGPDSEGFYLDNDAALGHRRLSIIDLKTGEQPIYNADKSKVIVYNGEVYNFKELREELKDYKFKTKTDTEVIIHGYEKWGKDVCSHLRGMFAFAIWDKNEKELFLARDGWGIKPLYYYFDGNVFMFASEIKAFLDHPDFKKELNENILSSYLCFNSCATEETFFKNVYRLNPGCTLTLKDNKIDIKEYFHLEFNENEEEFEVSVEKIKKAMSSSVEYHQIADVEVGSFLSSGIDSSYLVSLAKPDKTYTVGYDDPKYDEIKNAEELASLLNISNTSKKITKEEYLNNLENIIYHMDEPLADPSAIALYFASEIASKDVKVVMSGEGADELFGGYNSYQEEVTQSWYMKIPFVFRNIASKVASLFPDARGLNFIYRRGQHLKDYHIGLGRVFRDKEALSLVKNKNQVNTKEITKKFYERYQNDSTLVQRQVIDYYFWLVNDFLHAVDRNTMMFSLEARTPYLDKEVYEVARCLPKSAKVNIQTTKPALRKAAESVIPNESYKKKKLGFPVPLREWMKDDDLFNKIKEAFTSETARKFFNQNKILKLLEKQRTDDKVEYKKVWTIYIFILWYQIFFEKETV